MFRFLASAIMLVLQPASAAAQGEARGPQPGDRVEIRWESRSSFNAGDSEGNSQSWNVYVERVIAVSEAGVVLEFDLPPDTSAEDRARTWRFPVRVLRPPGGPLQLLNRAELEARVIRWLARANWTREVCGRWIFTWTETKIECDPQAVVETIAAIDLPAVELGDGVEYRDRLARAPGLLRRETRGSGTGRFVVDLEIDPEAALRQRAEADAVVREIMGDGAELRAAQEARSADRISGTMRVTFETDAQGLPRQRTRIVELRIEGRNGRSETTTTTETVTRRRLSRSRR